MDARAVILVSMHKRHKSGFFFLLVLLCCCWGGGVGCNPRAPSGKKHTLWVLGGCNFLVVGAGGCLFFAVWARTTVHSLAALPGLQLQSRTAKKDQQQNQHPCLATAYVFRHLHIVKHNVITWYCFLRVHLRTIILSTLPLLNTLDRNNSAEPCTVMCPWVSMHPGNTSMFNKSHNMDLVK